MIILMLGDVMGKPGRKALTQHLPNLVEEHRPDIVIANGENAAGGMGITKETALPLFDSGVDIITMGNHVWAQRGMGNLLETEPRIVRPANFPPGLPGKGAGVFKTRSGGKIGVINLLGRTFMQPVDDPFQAADKLVEEIRQETPVILVDFHAEATSEKGALAWALDGKVSAVIGTHTHVPTCDERVLPGGTAFITDVGMVGARDSILGMKVETVVQNFRTQVKQKFELAEGPSVVRGVVIDVDEATGHTRTITRVSVADE